VRDDPARDASRSRSERIQVAQHPQFAVDGHFQPIVAEVVFRKVSAKPAKKGEARVTSCAGPPRL